MPRLITFLLGHQVDRKTTLQPILPHSPILPLPPPHATASHLALPLIFNHLALKALHCIVFQIATPNETHEFRTDSENDRLRWMKLLGLLVMFPYSTTPEEPQNNPIKKSFRCKLIPTQYGAGMLTA